MVQSLKRFLKHYTAELSTFQFCNFSSSIEILQNLEYFGFSQLILGYKQTLQLRLRGIPLINGKFIKLVGYSISSAQ